MEDDFALGFVSQYIENFTDKGLVRSEYRMKAIGEAALLVGVASQIDCDFSNVIKDRLSPILQYACTELFDDEDDNTNILFCKCGVLAFTNRRETQEFQTCLQRLYAIAPEVFKRSISPEQMFFRSWIEGKHHDECWLTFIGDHLKKLCNHGANLSDLYDFTHIAMFSTSFGLYKNSLYRKYLLPLCPLYLNMSVQSQNWDAALETCVAYLCLEGRELTSVNLFVYQGLDGGLLSDGTKYDVAPNNHNEYSIFHTTLVFLIYQTLLHQQNS